MSRVIPFLHSLSLQWYIWDRISRAFANMITYQYNCTDINVQRWFVCYSSPLTQIVERARLSAKGTLSGKKKKRNKFATRLSLADGWQWAEPPVIVDRYLGRESAQKALLVAAWMESDNFYKAQAGKKCHKIKEHSPFDVRAIKYIYSISGEGEIRGRRRRWMHR